MPAELNLKAKTLSSLVWKFLERVGYQAIQIVVQVVLARLLTPDDFGVLAIMIVFVNVGNVVVQSGLNTALVQSERVEDSDFSTVLWMSLAISLVLYAAIFLSAPGVAEFYRMPSLIWPLRVLCLILIINAYSATLVAHVQRELEFRKVFLATIVSVVLSGAAGISAAVMGVGIWALVFQQLSYQLVNCLVLAIQVGWLPRLVFDLRRARELFAFGWKLLISGMLDTLYQSLSDLIVGAQFTKAELGIFSQGKRYPQAVGSILDGAVQPVMLSAIARVQDDRAAVKRLTRRGIKTSTFVVVPAMAAFAVIAPSLVPLLMGEQWQGCVPFLQIYCVVYAFLPVHTTNLQALNGTGHSNEFLKLEVIKKVYSCALLVIAAFVVKDLYAIAWASIIGTLISTFVNAWPNTKIIGYSFAEQIKDYLPSFALAGAAAAPALCIPALGLGYVLTIMLQLALMLALYLGLAYILRIETLSYLLTNALTLIAKGKE